VVFAVRPFHVQVLKNSEVAITGGVGHQDSELTADDLMRIMKVHSTSLILIRVTDLKIVLLALEYLLRGRTWPRQMQHMPDACADIVSAAISNRGLRCARLCHCMVDLGVHCRTYHLYPNSSVLGSSSTWWEVRKSRCCICHYWLARRRPGLIHSGSASSDGVEAPSASSKQDWRLLHLCSQYHVSKAS
jgi:hypothetical protein